MSDPKGSERPASGTPDAQKGLAANGQGVLSKLPRTRPQRASPRRAAARAASAAADAATAASTTTTPAPARSNGRPSTRAESAAARTSKRPTSKRASAGGQRVRGARARPARKAVAATVEPAPRQGFECEPERAGGTVHPPGGAELVASAAEIVGELAKAGVSTGERLLKDILSRLPLS